MNPNKRGCVIAGTHSGVGKTTWSLAMMALCQKKGWTVQPFKIGPDYIDTGFHSHLCHPRQSRNLDLFLLSPEYVQNCFAQHAASADISIVEGVMGLFDGKSTALEGSTSQMAKLLRLPVFLVVDGAGMASSGAAVVLGFQKYDPELQIAGVFLNRVNSESHFRWLKQSIEAKTGIPCLGYLPAEASIGIPERHLGLVTAKETQQIIEKSQKAAALLESRFDFEKFAEISSRVGAISQSVKPTTVKTTNLRIGYAFDEAFSFYYADNFDILRNAGTELIPFSPLKDQALPQNLDLLYLGGGFPEIYAEALAQNGGMKKAVNDFYLKGGFIYGECGGLMYLTEAFYDSENKRFDFVGLIPGNIRMTGKLQNFGYHEIKSLKSNLLCPAQSTLRSHEFHYSSWDGQSDAHALYQIGARLEGYLKDRLMASYQHLHFGFNSNLVTHLLESMAHVKI